MLTPIRTFLDKVVEGWWDWRGNPCPIQMSIGKDQKRKMCAPCFRHKKLGNRMMKCTKFRWSWVLSFVLSTDDLVTLVSKRSPLSMKVLLEVHYRNNLLANQRNKHIYNKLLDVNIVYYHCYGYVLSTMLWICFKHIVIDMF